MSPVAVAKVNEPFRYWKRTQDPPWMVQSLCATFQSTLNADRFVGYVGFDGTVLLMRTWLQSAIVRIGGMTCRLERDAEGKLQTKDPDESLE